MHNVTDRYLELIDSVPYLEVSLADQFIPKMLFQYTFMSPARYKSPIKVWTTVSEASNILSAGYAAFGRHWSEKDKKLLSGYLIERSGLVEHFIRDSFTTFESLFE